MFFIDVILRKRGDGILPAGARGSVAAVLSEVSGERTSAPGPGCGEEGVGPVSAGKPGAEDQEPGDTRSVIHLMCNVVVRARPISDCHSHIHPYLKSPPPISAFKFAFMFYFLWKICV